MDRHLIILIAILCFTISGKAQDSLLSPHTEVASQLAIGAANHLDTYLSPEKYRGTELRFISEVIRDSRHHLDTLGAPKYTYALAHEGTVDISRNRADKAREISAAYIFSYAAMRRWQIDIPGGPLILRAGAMADLNLGFTYNTRNTSNNPAQGYASLSLGANAMAQYNFSLWGQSFRANYELRIPFVGIMFSPNYGQSYYEIFNEGNYDHNIVFTSLPTIQLRQQLALDYILTEKTSLRLGYLCDIRQAKPNNLKQHHYFNAVTFGVVIKK